MADEIKDQENRGGFYGSMYGSYGENCGGGSYGESCGGGCGGGGYGSCYFFDTCPDECFVQILCELKGELIKVLTEGQCEGTIIGRLVSVARDFVNVSCDGSVAAIRLCKVVAVIPI